MIAVSNRLADELFRSQHSVCLLGTQANDHLPETLLRALQQTSSVNATEFNGGLLPLEDGHVMRVWVSPMGDLSQSKGTVIVLLPVKES